MSVVKEIIAHAGSQTLTASICFYVDIIICPQRINLIGLLKTRPKLERHYQFKSYTTPTLLVGIEGGWKTAIGHDFIYK